MSINRFQSSDAIEISQRMRDSRGRFVRGVTELKRWDVLNRKRKSYGLRIGAAVVGLSEALKMIRRRTAALENNVAQANVRIMKKIFATSQLYVPTDKGILKESGRIVEKESKGKSEYSTTGSPLRQEIVIEYGGVQAKYASAVHDIPPPYVTHGAEFLMKQAQKQLDTAIRRVDIRDITKRINTLKGYKRKGTIIRTGSHRPQERYQWVTYAFQLNLGFINKEYATVMKKWQAETDSLSASARYVRGKSERSLKRMV